MSAEISGGVVAGGCVHLQLCGPPRPPAADLRSGRIAARRAFRGHGQAEPYLQARPQASSSTRFIDQQGDNK